MDELIEFLQQTLAVDFYFEDDYVIETALRENLQELRSSRLHTAGNKNRSSFSTINLVQAKFVVYFFSILKFCFCSLYSTTLVTFQPFVVCTLSESAIFLTFFDQ